MNVVDIGTRRLIQDLVKRVELLEMQVKRLKDQNIIEPPGDLRQRLNKLNKMSQDDKPKPKRTSKMMDRLRKMVEEENANYNDEQSRDD